MDRYSGFTRRRAKRRRSAVSPEFLSAVMTVTVAALCVSATVLLVRGCARADEYAEVYGLEPSIEGISFDTPLSTAAPSCTPAAEEYALRVSIDGIETELELEEYLIGVVAGEMPASFEEEALKAQAVAARTFTALHMTGKAECKSSDCDICSSPACCQAYLTEEELRRAWESSYDANIARIRSAVEATRGIVAVYEGELISAVYHASSGDATEASSAVFAMQLPYLVSVESFEGASTPTTVKEYGYTEFAELINSAFPQAHMPQEPDEALIEVWGRTDSGRVQLIRLCDVAVTGDQLRQELGLKSSAFTIELENSTVSIVCRGFGHGVGMSQYGANAMAKQGSTYEQILLHFYTGIELGNIADFDVG